MLFGFSVVSKFIAGRLYRRGDGARGATRPAVIIATVGVSLGLFVMILSMAVTRGFRNQVSEKVRGFMQDIQVVNCDYSPEFEEYPVSCPAESFDMLLEGNRIRHAQRYVEKAGVLRTDSSFQGFMLKGVGQEYDFSFLESYLLEGEIPACSDSVASGGVLLSKTLADRLELSVGDKVDACFMQERIRLRRFTVSGIYQTNFPDYDKVYAITDIHTLQQINGWNAEQSSGIELTVADGISLYDAYMDARSVFDEITMRTNEPYMIRTTEQINSGLFAWLDILNVNVVIILLLMMGIAGFTIISGLLIIILERTSMIGMLKAMGAGNGLIRRIFLMLSARIVLKGMVIGDVLGIGLCLLQQRYHIIPLNPENYYLDSVPCELGTGWLLLLNIAVFVLSVLMLTGPSAVISRIAPSRSIRFE